MRWYRRRVRGLSKRGGLIAVAAVAALATLVPTAMAGKRVPSVVTIDNVVVCGTFPCPGYGTYGHVSSPRAACERRRTVKLRQVGETAFAQTTTDREGEWFVETTPEFNSDAEAVVTRKRLASGRICKADVSEPYHMGPPPP